MLTTLWVMSAASVVAMAAALVGRHAVSEGSARVELERARWWALGCERRAVAAVDGVMRDAPGLEEAALTWRTMAPRIESSPVVAGCDVSLEAAGTRLDINSVTEEMIVNWLGAIGLGDRASEMAAALLDWRDEDDLSRAEGAEREWYESMGRVTPRNAPLAHVAELRRVRGFETISGLDSLMDVEPGRISLATAPVSVLLAVPGITRETAERVVEMQQAGTPTEDLASLLGSISEQSRNVLGARYPDAVRATTPDPDAWTIRVRASRGLPRVTVVLEWRVIRTGQRCAVASTRSTL